MKLSSSEQSRVNGSKSKGPTSVKGKAISSQNALKHGFAATINIVLSIEDEPEFHRHVAGVRASFTPQNYMEETLVDQLASISWRQARLVGLETALLEAQMSLQDRNVCALHPTLADDCYYHLAQAWQALARQPKTDDASREQKDPSLPPDGYDINSLELVRRYQTSLDRQFRNTLLNLRQYRKDFAPTYINANANPLIGAPQPNEPSAPIEETNPASEPNASPTPPRPPATAETSRPRANSKQESSPAQPICPTGPLNSR